MKNINIKKSAMAALLIIIHVIAVGVITVNLRPIVQWYLQTVPALGVDLFNSATFVKYHLEHFSLPWNGFFDSWFGGFPLMLTFPQLAFYLMLPFGALFGLPQGVQVASCVALFAMVLIGYFAYNSSSRNPILALALSMWVAMSANIYGALTWAGSVPSFISQLTYPLALWAGALFVSKLTIRRFAAMVGIAGVSILIHPLEGVTFVVPALFICLLGGLLLHKVKLGKALGLVFAFIVGVLASSLSFTYEVLVSMLSSGVPSVVTPETATNAVVSEDQLRIAQFYKDQLQLIVTQTHPALFGMMVVTVILLVVVLFSRTKKRTTFKILPPIGVLVWTIAHPVLNLSGTLSFLRHEPYRAFWPIPFSLAAVIAQAIGIADGSCKSTRLGRIPIVWLYRSTFVVLVAAAVLLTQSVNTKSLTEMLTKNAEYSSAFPEAVSIQIRPDDQAKLKKQLIPDFIDPTDKNKRLYSSDQTVSIWWNSLYDLPLARGYLDPPVSTAQRGGFFLLDIAISNDSLVRDFGVTEESAYNQALFMIDWYGVHYFEGGVLNTKGANTPPSSYLTENDVFDKEQEITVNGAVLKWGTASGKAEYHPEIPQNLKYYRIKDEHTSPILAPADAPPVAVFSDYAGYEDVLRLLAAQNINSKVVIPVHAGQFVDDMPEEEIKQFKAVILHQYKYKNKTKAFNTLSSYVENGGMAFIDTGTEMPESNSGQLPEFFPFTSSKRSDQGIEWNISANLEHSLLQNVDVSDFGPLVYNGTQWKLTTPEDKIKEGATAILTHNDKAIVVEYALGSGKVIWSGMNLPYHYNQYKKVSEAVLFNNILRGLISTKVNDWKDAEVKFIGPNKARIKTSYTPAGFLFKQQAYENWQAQMVAPKHRPLKIYKAGPTYPGFMYVISKPEDKPVEVEFVYKPKLAHLVVGIINIGAFVLIGELLLIKGIVLRKLKKSLSHVTKKTLGKWWEKEE